MSGVPASTLEELRGVIRRLERARPPRPAPEPVEHALGGQLVDTADGPILRVRCEYPAAHRHGAATLESARAVPPAVLGLIARAGGDLPAGRPLVFLDVETTGLAGGTGTYAFLVGIGSFAGDRFLLDQYFLRDFDDEPALLAALAPVLGGAGAVVTFNGAGFDVPLLETRFVLGRRRWPASLLTVDLLRPARRVWTACLADCRLATLEREVLGLARVDDVAGALIPGLYFDFLRSRRPGPLLPVFAHNRDDVLSLATLLGWFGGALAGTGAPSLRPAELAGLGRLLEGVDLDRALVCYAGALDGGLAGDLGRRVRLRLAWWEKRRARWEAACALWEAAAAADGFDPRPWEELAKFHEHRRRDAGTALAIVAGALDLARGAETSPRVLQALAHRRGRLERRLQREAAP